MISRREALVAGSGMIAALGMGAHRAAAPLRTPALFLIDTTLAGASGAVAAAERAGVPTISFAGDVGAAWLGGLDHAWRGAPQPVAGVTYSGAFFCVEMLARARGLACRCRLPFPPSGSAGATRALFEMGNIVLTRTAMSPMTDRLTSMAALEEAGDHALAWLLQPLAKS